jgi:UDPglucose 6-dehydrogenase
MAIVKAARDVNRRQRERVVEKLLAEMKILKGRTIGLLGLAFKPHTDDLREAPALDVIRQLIERGARVKAHDPVAMERFKKEHPSLEQILCETPADVARDADALVMVTEWPQYGELDWESLAASMRTAVMLDGRHVIDRVRVTRAGFRYIGLAG